MTPESPFEHEPMMRVHRAAWVLPIAGPPIRDGWVAVETGRIVGVGGGREYPSGSVLDAPADAAILPGLINAHTHLELSWMAGCVPPSDSMGRWILALMALRRGSSPSEEAQRQAAAAALATARASGTAALGDVGNGFISADVLADAGVPSVLFHELIGFGPGDARSRADESAARVVRAVRPPVRPGLSPHAPYSVSPDLFRAIDGVVARTGLPSSVHLGESAEEIEFLMTGGGEIAEALKQLGAWNDEWSAPESDPAEYLDRLGVLRRGLLVVHCAQLSPAALSRLAARGCVIVSCPRSNQWVGAGNPPLDDFYASGAAVAFGTDSLASAPNLEMFAELAAARAASSVPASRLLESATRVGAEALGFGRALGTIEPGKRPELLSVRLPADVDDVEEYLVGGVPASDVGWL
jgi:cytosine/adenosine deaminase-related metal-dependent hydrolase